MSVTQALTDSSAARNESATDSSAVPERTRLHITPFNPGLLKVVVPPSVLPHASAISYHSVQTFPEKGFGYVELPTMEAQKIKKKLNGSILKGQKVRIEEARPEKRKRIVEEAQAAEAGAEEQDRKAAKKAKKLKRKDGILPGFELPDERHVKRGWTEPENKKDHKRKDKKDKDEKKEKKHKSTPSKYTTEKELLFKTKLPPNTVATAKPDKGVEKPKKTKLSSRDVVVHEFAKTTKHASFLKDNKLPKDAKTAADYVEGKGWVDQDGNVIEKESESRRKRREAKAEAEQKSIEREIAAAAAKEEKKSKKQSAVKETKRKSAKATTLSDEGSENGDGSVSDDDSSVVSSSSSNVSSSSEEESEEALSSEAEPEVAQEHEAEEESSSESESQVAHENAADQENIPQEDSGADVEMTDSTAKPGNAEDEAAKEVHPLEALFGRPKTPEDTTPTKLAPINTAFSFFGGGGDDDDDEEVVEEEANAPLTPYTRQDLQFRGMRSAAPTPDTAAIGRKFWRDEEEDEEEDDDEVEDSMMHIDANTGPVGTKGPERTGAAAQGSEEAQQSEFAKHFWEHRGDYNRTWKKRRREAMKVQRQRENRRLGRKVV